MCGTEVVGDRVARAAVCTGGALMVRAVRAAPWGNEGLRCTILFYFILPATVACTKARNMMIPWS